MDRAAAGEMVEISTTAVAARGRFSVALSGGETPRGLLALLASEQYRGRIAWDRTHVFWADERCVPPDHKDSNYRLATELLLSKVPLPTANIHRIHGEEPPSIAADRYQEELASFFGDIASTFDLIILGMGADGHTASLFPGASTLGETKRLTVPVPPSGMGHARVTLTFPAINRARNVLFLVAGEPKAQRVREVLEGEGSGLPAGLVRPERGSLLWCLDKGAAGMLHVKR